jgi:MinD superfamily P-loop ATPase
LHLVMDPTVLQTEDFCGGSQARIDPDLCDACGQCRKLCRFDAIRQDGPTGRRGISTLSVDSIGCEGCGVCAHFCPTGAIELAPVINGQWYISDTRGGPMVHARLGVAEENSGKLVSVVRMQAKRIAEQRNLDLVLIDGAPGIGCPVIASIAGADLVLVVTEPTLSGLHDLKRVADLTKHFDIQTVVCINKWDLNPDIATDIERQATERGIRVIGRVRYDRAVTRAQIKGQSVTELAGSGAAFDILDMWEAVQEDLSCPA